MNSSLRNALLKNDQFFLFILINACVLFYITSKIFLHFIPSAQLLLSRL